MVKGTSLKVEIWLMVHHWKWRYGEWWIIESWDMVNDVSLKMEVWWMIIIVTYSLWSELLRSFLVVTQIRKISPHSTFRFSIMRFNLHGNLAIFPDFLDSIFGIGCKHFTNTKIVEVGKWYAYSSVLWEIDQSAVAVLFFLPLYDQSPLHFEVC